MNQAVGEKNCLDMLVGGRRSFRPFTRNEFCKCIGIIILSGTFGVKGQHIWGKIESSVSNKR